MKNTAYQNLHTFIAERTQHLRTPRIPVPVIATVALFSAAGCSISSDTDTVSNTIDHTPIASKATTTSFSKDVIKSGLTAEEVEARFADLTRLRDVSKAAYESLKVVEKGVIADGSEWIESHTDEVTAAKSKLSILNSSVITLLEAPSLKERKADLEFLKTTADTVNSNFNASIESEVWQSANGDDIPAAWEKMSQLSDGLVETNLFCDADLSSLVPYYQIQSLTNIKAATGPANESLKSFIALLDKNTSGTLTEQITNSGLMLNAKIENYPVQMKGSRLDLLEAKTFSRVETANLKLKSLGELLKNKQTIELNWNKQENASLYAENVTRAKDTLAAVKDLLTDGDNGLKTLQPQTASTTQQARNVYYPSYFWYPSPWYSFGGYSPIYQRDSYATGYAGGAGGSSYRSPGWYSASGIATAPGTSATSKPSVGFSGSGRSVSAPVSPAATLESSALGRTMQSSGISQGGTKTSFAAAKPGYSAKSSSIGGGKGFSKASTGKFGSGFKGGTGSISRSGGGFGTGRSGGFSG
jgi:hypothetical protein